MKHRNYSLLAVALLLSIAPACLAQHSCRTPPAISKSLAGSFQCGDAEKHKSPAQNAPTCLDRADREMVIREWQAASTWGKSGADTCLDRISGQEPTSDQFVWVTASRAGDQHRITKLALQGTARPTEFALLI